MPSRAVPVSQRAQGERQSHRRAAAAPDDVCEVCDVEQVDWKRKYEDVVAELGRVRTQRQVARKKVGELAAKLEEYESAATPPALSSKQTLSRHARKFAKQLQAYAASDRAKLMVAALHAASKGTGKDLREDVLLTTSFKKLRRALYKVRDQAIAKHLKETVFSADAFSLLRLITKLSKRECGMIQQAFKYERFKDGSKKRFKLAPDSQVPCAEIFSLPEIVKYEAEALKSTQLELKEHDDKRGADVSGKPFAIDRVIMSQLKQDGARYGGMATSGTYEDPHLWLITGDGAGLSRAESGIRVGLFAGSTELLNQSSMDVTTVLFYKVCGQGSRPLCPFLASCVCVFVCMCILRKLTGVFERGIVPGAGGPAERHPAGPRAVVQRWEAGGASTGRRSVGNFHQTRAYGGQALHAEGERAAVAQRTLFWTTSMRLPRERSLQPHLQQTHTLRQHRLRHHVPPRPRAGLASPGTARAGEVVVHVRLLQEGAHKR